MWKRLGGWSAVQEVIISSTVSAVVLSIHTVVSGLLVVGFCRMLVLVEVVSWLCAVFLVLWRAIDALAYGIVCLGCIGFRGVSLLQPRSFIGCNGSVEVGR